MSRKILTWTLGAAPLAVLVAMVVALTAAPAHGQPSEPQSTCSPGPLKWADPVDLVLGDTSQVTIAMTHTCGAEKLPVDLIFVVDISNSMMRDTTRGDATQVGPGVPGRTPPSTPGGTPAPKETPTPGGIGGGRVPAYDPCNAARGSIPGRGATQIGPGPGPIDPGPTSPVRGTPPGGPTAPPTRTVVPTRTAAPGIGGPNPALPEPFGNEDLIRDVQSAIRDFLDQPEVQADLTAGRLRTGLVSFSDIGRRVVRLTNNVNAVRTGVGRLRGGGSSQLALGLRVAVQDLQNASATGGGAGQEDRVRLLMVYSDGQFCARDVRSAGTQRAEIETIAIGVGRDWNRGLMTQLASEREFVLELRELRELTRIYTRLLPGTRTVTMDTLTVVEVLSSDVRYVPDSAVPPPSEIVTRTLKWTFAPPTSPLTITFGVEPLIPGLVPVSESSDASWLDSATLIGAAKIPNVTLNVAVPTPTVTPTPTNTPTPTATATPEPEPRYLPFLVNRWPPPPSPTPECRPSEQTVDIALVIDTSGSMLLRTHPGGAIKLDAAIDAAKGLVALLKFPADGSLDQAAVISFNAEARTVTPLTGDAALISQGLDQLPLYSVAGTHIDLGLKNGYDELTGPGHRPGRNRAVILLTDGRLSPDVDPALVIAQADAIKALGITLWTVALGTDVDTALLLAAASGPDFFKQATTEDLRLIYEEIARVVPCN